jgi:exodeoxyribonuclease V beta subunit
MLQGFIDLVFVHSGRYYILDWKSNHLGNSPNDYGPARMQEAMCRSGYILQYHLYTLALDRLLKVRLPGYDYETHFGGAIYLFLRGVTKTGTGSGIYHGRPSLEFINRAGEMMLTPLF